jgi:hypothetical protein
MTQVGPVALARRLEDRGGDVPGRGVNVVNRLSSTYSAHDNGFASAFSWPQHAIYVIRHDWVPLN